MLHRWVSIRNRGDAYRKRGFQTPKAHKNLDFVLKTPENRGSRPQKRTKTSILCSKSLKTGISDPKSAQKPRFCARMLENGGSRPQKRTKTSILCSKCSKTGVPDPKSAQKTRFRSRNARKRGFRTPKAHKNLDFVLGERGIGTRERGN